MGVKSSAEQNRHQPTQDLGDSLFEHKQPGTTLLSRLIRSAQPWGMMGLLITSDLTSVSLAWAIGMGVRFAMRGPFDYYRYYGLWPVLLLWVVTFGIMGLYRGGGVTARIFITPVEELRRTTVGTTWAFMTVAAAMFLLQGGLYYSRTVLATSWVSALVLVPFGRSLLRRVFARRPWWGSSAVIFGAGKTAHQVVAILQHQPELGLKPVAVLTDKPCADPDIRGVPILGDLQKARQIGPKLGIRYCIVALDEDSNNRLFEIHKEYGDYFPHMMVIPELGGLSSLWILARDVGGILGLEIRHNLLIKGNRWVKRSLDLAVAIPALTLTAPLLAAMIVWVKLINRGPALYGQEREGQHGKRIRVWKLRTMYVDAEARLQKLLQEDPEARAQWQRFFKLKNDPRILPGVGVFLRKFSLDEFPQLWNVIIGAMSIVGPRPFPPYHLETFDEEFRSLRRSVLPGVTGLWQATARSEGDVDVQRRLDTYYIRNWSLWLDLHVIARTFWVVVSGRGAY